MRANALTINCDAGTAETPNYPRPARGGKNALMKRLGHWLLYEAEFLGDHTDLPLLVRLQDLNLHARTSEAPKGDRGTIRR
jgi:hypothetical protein